MLHSFRTKWVILTRMGPILSLHYQESLCGVETVQTAEMLLAGTHRIKMRASRSLREGMKIRIHGSHGSASAVITRCKADRSGFLVSAHILSGIGRLLPSQNGLERLDPGVLSLDNFLSEGQLNQLLAEVETAAAGHGRGNSF